MYNSYQSDYDAALFGGFLVTFFIIILVIGVVGYVITALIYYYTTKTNGLGEISFWSWIPLLNVYALFALGSTKTSLEEIKKDALKFLLIYIGLTIISIIPFIGILSSIAMIVIGVYFMYRLFFRWTGESGTAILFVVLTIITGSIFYYVYGLIKMKKPFVI
ncbi:hypothetical protein [Ureibacillus chungkukjangi]|uniref:Uncharacterized protein n=1 Tax=Ureibacillus chungkukjangi TaxID=1202712 RepID=A0A318TX38_9BACL|nr:hypothetical protein [Ureibacillus chungkukjangi]PYF07578.1 hypothetical protein BJ095_10486 [Ureibacillus chungkukjangi]